MQRLQDEPATRHRALALVRQSLWSPVQQVLAAVHCDVEFAASQSLFVTRIESDEPHCAIIDADATNSPESLLQFSRSLWPRAVLVAIAAPWSDGEAELRALSSAVLHAPVRTAEWEPLLDRLLRERAGPG